jgi:hypothetical protein
MPGLVPGIHVLFIFDASKKDVDGRVKPGHDKHIGRPKLYITDRTMQAVLWPYALLRN